MFYPDDPACWRPGSTPISPPRRPRRSGPRWSSFHMPGIDYSGDVAARALRALDAPEGSQARGHFRPQPSHAARRSRRPSRRRLDDPARPRAGRRRGVAAILPLDGVAVEARPFAGEHSLEMPLIFVQRLLPGVEIVPVLVGDAAPELVETAIERLWGGPETAVCISSDLSHFLSAPKARARDDATRAKIEAGRWSELGPGDACGCPRCAGRSAGGARAACARPESLSPRPTTKGGPRERVVGYGAFAFEEAEAARLCDADRARLLALAAERSNSPPHTKAKARDRARARSLARAVRSARAPSSRWSAGATCAAASARPLPAAARARRRGQCGAGGFRRPSLFRADAGSSAT